MTRDDLGDLVVPARNGAMEEALDQRLRADDDGRDRMAATDLHDTLGPRAWAALVDRDGDDRRCVPFDRLNELLFEER